MFWYGERLNKRKGTNNPIYTGCCMEGQVKLPFLKDSPKFMWWLLTSNDPLPKHFRENVRAYNMLFSFTSLGGTVDHSVKKGRGPQMFALQGENYHLIGSLKPKDDDYAKFGQMWILDTDEEVNHRLNVMR